MDPHDLLFRNRLDITKTHPLEDVSFTVAGCVSDVFWEEPLEFQVVSLLWISNDFCMLPSRFCWLLPNFTGWFSYRSDFFSCKKKIYFCWKIRGRYDCPLFNATFLGSPKKSRTVWTSGKATKRSAWRTAGWNLRTMKDGWTPPKFIELE